MAWTSCSQCWPLSSCFHSATIFAVTTTWHWDLLLNPTLERQDTFDSISISSCVLHHLIWVFKQTVIILYRQSSKYFAAQCCCDILILDADADFFYLKGKYFNVGKWNLLSAVSSWTHSRLCRAGWMWLRETWTDSFRSMRCSCLKMDMGTRPFDRNLSRLANWLWQSDLVLIALLSRSIICSILPLCKVPFFNQ